MTTINRRQFVSGLVMSTAGTVAGRTWAAPASSKSRSPNEKLNIAIIGCSGRGAANLAAVAGENIVALCDVDQKRADAAFAKFPQARRYRDFREIGLGLYVNNGPDEWEAALEDVLADLPDRQEEAASLVEMSRRWHVQNQLHVHHQVYSKAISNFSDDHGRLPGVFKVAPANGAGEGGDGE